ncbi:hypothetical protein FB45DRAFT_1131698 [Roridomyces roridus]|uniref:DUF5060 domain-containing protein n=1 Tax=Roridomyces roridus TaxID=1738132 RepID=A0AAD7C3H6_9AGAR|nr:hypothetical protein FB45DRAFT_1131698 [Roridomyces roridus]
MTVTPLWDAFEASFRVTAQCSGNPFTSTQFDAAFTQSGRDFTVQGFYDGESTWRVRFMPDALGIWSFTTRSNVAALDGQTGNFTCIEALPGVHGPVHVHNQFHFAHADGTPYRPFGTTCYAWTHQPEPMQAQTLTTLESAGFNKLRMAIFPKHYIYCENEPLLPLFETTEDQIDLTRPNVAAFQLLDRQIVALGKLGIEADVILFHPYDRWGFCQMTIEQDERYLRYVIARLAAYRNVWWSMANEYDFLLDHLLSIHNGEVTAKYDYTKPYITHICVQDWDVKRTAEWRAEFKKPVVNDEMEYEGNIPRPWGNISALEMVHRFWVTVLRGGYGGHGETYLHDQDLLWWAKGGVLRGESAPRIKFLRDLLDEDVRQGLTPIEHTERWEFSRVSGAHEGEYRLLYFGEHQPAHWAIGLPKDKDGLYELDSIDVWNMTVTRVEKAELPVSPALRQRGGIIVGAEPEAAFGVRLPGKPYHALRVRPRREDGRV